MACAYVKLALSLRLNTTAIMTSIPSVLKRKQVIVFPKGTGTGTDNDYARHRLTDEMFSSVQPLSVSAVDTSMVSIDSVALSAILQQPGYLIQIFR